MFDKHIFYQKTSGWAGSTRGGRKTKDYSQAWSFGLQFRLGKHFSDERGLPFGRSVIKLTFLFPPRATGVGSYFHGFCPFLGCYFWAWFFVPFFFHFFWDRTSLSDLRSGGNWRVKPRYCESRCPGDAENIIWCQKKWGKKEEDGMSISKKSRMSDLRSVGEIGLKPLYSGCGRYRDAKKTCPISNKIMYTCNIYIYLYIYIYACRAPGKPRRKRPARGHSSTGPWTQRHTHNLVLGF